MECELSEMGAPIILLAFSSACNRAELVHSLTDTKTSIFSAGRWTSIKARTSLSSHSMRFKGSESNSETMLTALILDLRSFESKRANWSLTSACLKIKRQAPFLAPWHRGRWSFRHWSADDSEQNIFQASHRLRNTFALKWSLLHFSGCSVFGEIMRQQTL